jgi:hypothetical protein
MPDAPDDPDDPNKPDQAPAPATRPPAADDGHQDTKAEVDAEVERQVSRMPRAKFFKQRELMMIVMLLVGLFCVLALRKPCARGVARMVDSFDEPDAGVPHLRKPK